MTTPDAEGAARSAWWLRGEGLAPVGYCYEPAPHEGGEYGYDRSMSARELLDLVRSDRDALADEVLRLRVENQRLRHALSHSALENP